MLAGARATLALLLKKSPHAVAVSKHVILEAEGKTTTEALALEKRGFRQVFEHSEKREGVQAFIEKRQARF
jgi:enoyl-CoA hydratase/carnithine racemase